MDGVLLRSLNLTKRFGNLFAVDGVTFTLKEGEVLGLVGPNGAGKTTLLNILSGFYPPDRGQFWVIGKRCDGLPPYRLAEMGLARTFQVAKVFPNLTIRQNIKASMLNPRNHGKTDVSEILETMVLKEHANRLARELSGGQQKLLEFAMAFASNPHIYLLDEPFAGVHPTIRGRMSELILEESSRGKGFVIVSHELPTLMRISHRVLVMSLGKVIVEGAPQEVTSDRKVIEAYLGEEF